MIDQLIGLYRKALQLKRQFDELKIRESDLFDEARKVGLIEGANPEIDKVIEKIKSRLEGELPGLIQAKDYKTVEIVANLFTGSFLHKKDERESEPETKHKKEIVVESGFDTPLPTSVYMEAEDFGDLLKKAKKFRDSQGENGSKLTWTRIAEYSGICLGYLNNIRGGQKPSDEVIKNLAAVLGGDKQKFMDIAKKK